LEDYRVSVNTYPAFLRIFHLALAASASLALCSSVLTLPLRETELAKLKSFLVLSEVTLPILYWLPI
jgi:hypothetical protein